MLLILQRRGRTTARDLAEQLEVSERTILRDIEALSEAGVPIYASPGRGGGIELLDGFQTKLTGLTADEARNLFLVGQPLVAHRLGVAAPVRTTREKLLAALPGPLAAQAEHLASWFVHDPDPWEGSRLPHGELLRISGAIRHRRHIEIMFTAQTRVVSPLGLVLKAGSWHLVHLGEHEVKVTCLDDLRATRLRVTPFDAPDGFDLDGFWSHYCRSRRPSR